MIFMNIDLSNFSDLLKKHGWKTFSSEEAHVLYRYKKWNITIHEWGTSRIVQNNQVTLFIKNGLEIRFYPSRKYVGQGQWSAEWNVWENDNMWTEEADIPHDGMNQLIEAISDPSLAPILLGMKWAAPVIEELLK